MIYPLKLLSLVHALDPDLVVLGGVLSPSGEILLPTVHHEMQRRAPRWNEYAAQVVLTGHGLDACDGWGGYGILKYFDPTGTDARQSASTEPFKSKL